MGFSINTVCVSGNLTRDPELRHLPSGAPVCQFGIAYNERRKDANGDWGDVAHFFDVTLWGKQGEWFASNVSKGTGVVVQGRLRWRSWEKDGQKRSAVDITADHVFVPRDSGGTGYTGRSDVPVSTDDFSPPIGSGGFGVPTGGTATATPQTQQTPYRPDDDSDIPFAWRPVEEKFGASLYNPFD